MHFERQRASFWMLLLVILLGAGFGGSTRAAGTECLSADLCLGTFGDRGQCVAPQTGSALHPYQLESQVPINVRNGCLSKLTTLLESKTRDTVPVTLYLHGVEMKDLPLTLSRSTPGDAMFTFTLHRASDSDNNRDAWTRLLGSQHGAVKREMELAVAVGSVDLPTSVSQTIHFQVETPARLGALIGIGLLAFAGLYVWFVGSPSILRDAKHGPYSLGRSQMAFWFLLVIVCLVSTLIATGGLERLPPQVLILLGISSATGFASRVINNTKRANLTAEQNALETAKQSNAPTFLLGGGAARLQEIADALQLPTLSTWKDFLMDICSDGDGISIYRVQVVFWTIVLGGVFVWTVTQVVAMPEFPEGLLMLLGISNGTYVALKVPESE